AAYEGVVAPGAVVLISTDTLSEKLLAMARSGMPSPFRSPIATETGKSPVVKSVLAEYEGVVAPGAVVFSSTDTLLEPKLTMARSDLPSPFRSPIATEKGLVPVVKSVFAAYEGVV